jgi:hypothetical protein
MAERLQNAGDQALKALGWDVAINPRQDRYTSPDGVVLTISWGESERGWGSDMPVHPAVWRLEADVANYLILFHRLAQWYEICLTYEYVAGDYYVTDNGNRTYNF